MKRLFSSYFLLVTILTASLDVFSQTEKPVMDGELNAPSKALIPVPVPSLDNLEPAVANQIFAVQQSMRKLAMDKQTPQDEVEEAFGLMGRIYHAYEIFDSAGVCYTNACRLDPNDYQWPHMLGYLREQQGALDEALGFYTQSMESNPQYLASRVRLGRVLIQLNRLEEAKQILGVMPLEGPQAAAVLQSVGEIALAEQKYENAIAPLKRALEMVPEANRIHYLLGMAHRGIGQIEKAEKELELSGPIGIRPPDPLVDQLPDLLEGERVYLIRGRMAYGAGDYEEAVGAFEKALDAAPESIRAMVNLAAALVRLDRHSDAIPHLRKAVETEPAHFNARFNLGVVLMQQKLIDEAIIHLRRAAELMPSDVQAVWELVQALNSKGFVREAIDRLYGLGSRLPNEENVVLQLALLLQNSNRHAEAGYVLMQAHTRFPDRGRTAQMLVRHLATCPDKTLRNGPVALDLAKILHQSQPNIENGELLALALCENNLCTEAEQWVRQLFSQYQNIQIATKTRLETLLALIQKGEACRP